MEENAWGSNSAENRIVALSKIITAQKNEIFRLMAIIDNLPGSIYWKDPNGVYQGRNRYAAEKNYVIEKNVGPSFSSIIGKTDYDIFPREIADEYRRHDLAVLKNGSEITSEEQMILPSGEKLIQMSCKRPIRDENGNISGIVGNTIDITKLKAIEAELKSAKEVAEKASQIKTEFIRNMEHDIRTPFSGIWGIANLLWEQETDPSKKQLLNDIVCSAKELLDYCNIILDLSKIELGNLPILAKKISIRDLLKSVIDIEKPAAKYKGLALKYAIDPLVPAKLIGDPHRLSRILINLISNAIKFTAKGHVLVEIATVPAIDQANCLLLIQVSDSGVGLTQEKQDFIYEKLSDSCSSSTSYCKGIGLGLIIVKKFIAELNGEIEIASEIGIGTKFSCLIPYKLPLGAVQEVLQSSFMTQDD